MREDILFVEKYRPRTVEDTILPEYLKSTFQEFVDKKTLPNLILSGTSGVGKTTIARAVLEEMKADYIIINGSMRGNIDTLRNEIQQFASSVSLTGGRKYVILDEADYLNPNSTQPALRNFMEQYSKNCGFILTCNSKNRLLPALHSRCGVIDFKIPKKESAKLAKQFFVRIKNILDQEGIEYDSKVLVQIVKKYFPDYRRVLNELQRYSPSGKIDTGILTNMEGANITELVGMMKEKNFTGIRKWVGENSDVDATVLFRQLYNSASECLEPGAIPQLVLILADYQYKAAFVADPEINITACLTEIMANCSFK